MAKAVALGKQEMAAGSGDAAACGDPATTLSAGLQREQRLVIAAFKGRLACLQCGAAQNGQAHPARSAQGPGLSPRPPGDWP
jgi:hypothetical protein